MLPRIMILTLEGSVAGTSWLTRLSHWLARLIMTEAYALCFTDQSNSLTLIAFLFPPILQLPKYQ